MSAFGIVPDEPPRISDIGECAPQFDGAVGLMLMDLRKQGFNAMVYETLRTDERQAWLYGFGRRFDDGRGKVTNAPSGDWSWHRYGVACDIVHASRYWNATPEFWAALGASAAKHGLTWGGTWKAKDLPHVQFGKCRRSPSIKAVTLYAEGGLEAVWQAVGAD